MMNEIDLDDTLNQRNKLLTMWILTQSSEGKSSDVCVRNSQVRTLTMWIL